MILEAHYIASYSLMKLRLSLIRSHSMGICVIMFLGPYRRDKKKDICSWFAKNKGWVAGINEAY